MPTGKPVTFTTKLTKKQNCEKPASCYEYNNLLKGIFFYRNSFRMKKKAYLVIWVIQIQFLENHTLWNDPDPVTALT